jgi:hypothetical protein
MTNNKRKITVGKEVDRERVILEKVAPRWIGGEVRWVLKTVIDDRSGEGGS